MKLALFREMLFCMDPITEYLIKMFDDEIHPIYLQPLWSSPRPERSIEYIIKEGYRRFNAAKGDWEHIDLITPDWYQKQGMILREVYRYIFHVYKLDPKLVTYDPTFAFLEVPKALRREKRSLYMYWPGKYHPINKKFKVQDDLVKKRKLDKLMLIPLYSWIDVHTNYRDDNPIVKDEELNEKKYIEEDVYKLLHPRKEPEPPPKPKDWLKWRWEQIKKEEEMKRNQIAENIKELLKTPIKQLPSKLAIEYINNKNKENLKQWIPILEEIIIIPCEKITVINEPFAAAACLLIGGLNEDKKEVLKYFKEILTTKYNQRLRSFNYYVKHLNIMELARNKFSNPKFLSYMTEKIKEKQATKNENTETIYVTTYSKITKDSLLYNESRENKGSQITQINLKREEVDFLNSVDFILKFHKNLKNINYRIKKLINNIEIKCNIIYGIEKKLMEIEKKLMEYIREDGKLSKSEYEFVYNVGQLNYLCYLINKSRNSKINLYKNLLENLLINDLNDHLNTIEKYLQYFFGNNKDLEDNLAILFSFFQFPCFFCFFGAILVCFFGVFAGSFFGSKNREKEFLLTII